MLLLETLHLRGEFGIFGCVPAETAVRHGLDDVELSTDTGGQEPAVHADRVGKEQITGPGLHAAPRVRRWC